MEKRKFDKLFKTIITEMTANSFYPAKYVDGSQAVGTNFKGEEQIWMIGPVEDKFNYDYLTGEKLPQYTTVLWLPNKKAPHKGIVISMDSYEKAKTEYPDKLEQLGLTQDINWELA